MTKKSTSKKRPVVARKVEPVVRCMDCIYFVRGRWKNMLTGEDEGPQYGGKCDMLQKALGLDNSSMWMMPALYVQDTFGCVLGRTSNPSHHAPPLGGGSVDGVVLHPDSENKGERK